MLKEILSFFFVNVLPAPLCAPCWVSFPLKACWLGYRSHDLTSLQWAKCLKVMVNGCQGNECFPFLLSTTIGFWQVCDIILGHPVALQFSFWTPLSSLCFGSSSGVTIVLSTQPRLLHASPLPGSDHLNCHRTTSKGIPLSRFFMAASIDILFWPVTGLHTTFPSIDKKMPEPWAVYIGASEVLR